MLFDPCKGWAFHPSVSHLHLLLFGPSVWFDSSRPQGLQHTLPFTISQSLLKLMSIGSMMPSSYLILCRRPPPQSIPPAFSLSQLQGLFQWVSSLNHAKVLEFQIHHQSFQCTPTYLVLKWKKPRGIWICRKSEPRKPQPGRKGSV